MFRYEFTFKGLWLGGKVVVVAPEFQEALRLASVPVTARHFEPSTLELTDWKEITLPDVVYFYDGNY